MKSFHTIAIPHKDILEGKFTLDVYAANLWDVANNRGPEEYKIPDEFFKKTYETKELNNLYDIVNKRIKGNGGDPVIQLDTPFGGGKTHALIALYHKAKEWNAKTVIIVGDEIKSGDSIEKFDTFWGLIENQLTGKIDNFQGSMPPGGADLRKFLDKHSPLIILMDELIPYLNKADAVSFGGKSLASLTFNFIKTLTDAISSIQNASLIITSTPSNPYDRTPRGEEIVKTLHDITERRKIVKSPVHEDEVSMIIKRRLFSRIDGESVKAVVNAYIKYAEENSILPQGIEVSEYNKKFKISYPFLPEVIEVLYHNWGSFPNFQRTRGVLRLLALVVNSVKDQNIPYISLADFDLSNQEIRRELISHIENTYDGIVHQDITAKDSGSKKVDKKIAMYRALKLGTRSATTIFMYSFSGGTEKGINLEDIKRLATTVDNPASVVGDLFEDLTHSLFFLKEVNGSYLFSTEPNLNHVLYIKMENIPIRKIEELERDTFRNNISNKILKTFIWPTNPNDIPDNRDFKLIILKDKNDELIKKFIEYKGNSPRVHRNTIFFLIPNEPDKVKYINLLKRYISFEELSHDTSINLAPSQKKDIQSELKKLGNNLNNELRSLYRILLITEKNQLKEVDLGIPTYGDNRMIDDEVYDKLRENNEILERIVPLAIKEKYLRDNEYVGINQIYNTSLTTQGETRYLNLNIILKGIVEGVSVGEFGLGIVENNQPVCKYFKQKTDGLIDENSFIISKKLCDEQLKESKNDTSTFIKDENKTITETEKSSVPPVSETIQRKVFEELVLNFQLPKGKVSDVLKVINYLSLKFNDIRIQLKAQNGKISEQDLENKIKEAFDQMGIKLE